MANAVEWKVHTKLNIEHNAWNEPKENYDSNKMMTTCITLKKSKFMHLKWFNWTTEGTTCMKTKN